MMLYKIGLKIKVLNEILWLNSPRELQRTMGRRGRADPPVGLAFIATLLIEFDLHAEIYRTCALLNSILFRVYS
ncbi:hypothetical protein bAD24_I13560 [Burkholderia sp. AD24]|nr:hypothetical protein bAD24_I13560 [Burkholderia sp. AD24]